MGNGIGILLVGRNGVVSERLTYELPKDVLKLRRDIMMVFGKGILLLLILTLAMGSAGWLSWDQGLIENENAFLDDQLDLLARVDAVKDAGQVTEGKTSALVQQAFVFAQYLDPPKTVSSVVEPKENKPTPVKQSPVPKVITPKFKLLATSVHGHDPYQSMALIEEIGSKARWVRVGEPVGHQVVDSISKGKLVMGDRFNDDTDEMLISREPRSGYQVARNLKRNLKGGTLRVEEP